MKYLLGLVLVTMVSIASSLPHRQRRPGGFGGGGFGGGGFGGGGFGGQPGFGGSSGSGKFTWPTLELDIFFKCVNKPSKALNPIIEVLIELLCLQRPTQEHRRSTPAVSAADSADRVSYFRS